MVMPDMEWLHTFIIIVAITFIQLILRSFLPSYAEKKGENLAVSAPA
jgi:hypothetical protein